MQDSERVSLQDVIYQLKKHRIFFLSCLILFFLAGTGIKTFYFGGYLLQQGLLIRQPSGEEVDFHYLNNLRQFLINHTSIRNQNSTLSGMSPDVKIVPFAGIKAKGDDFKNGYILIFRLRVQEPEKGKRILEEWYRVFEQEITRLNQEAGLSLSVFRSKSPEIVLTPIQSFKEVATVSFLIALVAAFAVSILKAISQKREG